MIKNERQYRITKAQVERFQRDVAHLQTEQPDGDVHPLIWKAQQDAMESQLEDLRAEVAEYEALRTGRQRVLHVESFDEFPQALIRARIAAGISQKDLGDRLGLKEQQIQRYEATNYSSASLERVREVLGALNLTVREDVFLPQAEISSDFFFKRLKEVGFDREFVVRRLLPSNLAERLHKGNKSPEVGQFVLRAAAVVGRVLGVVPGALFGEEPLQLHLQASQTARFKVSAEANERRLSAYTVYAHHLALLLLEATADLPPQPVPTSAEQMRRAIVELFGEVSFANALRYAWSLGIPILPLSDSGAFHGACWRTEGRNVIVLKQQSKSLARWLFDLLHELRHAGQEPECPELSVIEEKETSSERRESEEEKNASRFAGDVMLGGRAEELVEACVNAAKGSVERLKATLPIVAKRGGVPVDVLANYMAFRLSLQSVNWWGTANNLQASSDEPWRIARDVLLEQVDFSFLNPTDRALLQQALVEEV